MPAPETSCTGYRPSRPSLLSVKRIAERYYDKVGQHSTPAAVITAAWRGPLLERQGVPQRMVITNQGDLASWSCARGMHLCAAAWYTRVNLGAGKLRGERPCTHSNPEGGVVVVGGLRLIEDGSILMLDSIFHLPHPGQDGAWVELPQKLKTPKSRHVAFMVPDSLTNCN